MSATRQLSGPPNTLGLSLRAALPLLPGASLLPFVAGHGHQIPNLKLRLEGATLPHDRLAAYARVCEFPPGDALPATAPHLLAFPLHMVLMTDGAFPFGAVGLVHIRNRIAVGRPIAAAEPLDITVHATQLNAHPRGLTFTILTEISASGEPVWEEQSTMLHRQGPHPAGNQNGDRGGALLGAALNLTPTAQWTLRQDLGRRYAGVSGDRNPIHLHPLGARLFGFPQAIAHGMWTKARCLAALAPSLPDAYTVEVAFRKPVLLPSEVVFATASAEDRLEFAVRSVRDSEQIHLEGTVSW